MRDDLSPMLSQPYDDNAPMISGRGTKIIADARGAYLAGNVPALIERLSAPQQQVFRLAVIAFAYDYAELAFHLLPDDAPEHDQLAQIKAWLDDPTPDPDRTLLDQLLQFGVAHEGGLWRENEIGGYSTESPAGDVMLRLALTLSVRTAAQAATFATEAVIQACWMGLRGATPYYWHGRRVSPRYKRQFRWLALRYQLEAAWALLRGQKPPALDALPEHPTTDLSALITRMSTEQRLTFRQHIIDQGLQWMLRTMDWGREHPAEWASLEAVREWVADPSEAHALRAAQLINAIPYGSDPRAQSIRNRVRSLIDAIRANSEISAAIMAMEPFVPTLDRSESQTRWPVALDAVQAWQIQAAWAMVHHEAPPRMWLVENEVAR